MLYRRVLHTILGGLIAVLAASVALAAKPSIRTSEGSFVIEDACDFPIREDYRERITVMRTENEEGTVIRAQFHVRWEGTLTNLETGTRVRDDGHYTVFRDFEAGTTTWIGFVYGITLPHHGVVVLDAGKIMFDDATGNILFDAGPHAVLAGGEEALCPALGGA